MRTSMILGLLASVAILAGCNTVRGVGSDVASVADAFDPTRTYETCGSYGLIDRNGDGRISNSEWNDYRAGGYSYWDANHDGRISRAEYANCCTAAASIPPINAPDWEPSYSVFDTNHDGYLSADEYWNAQAYSA